MLTFVEHISQFSWIYFNSIQCSVFSSPQFSHIFGSNIFSPVFPTRICKSTASGPFCDRSPVKLEINFELLISKYINIKSFFLRQWSIEPWIFERTHLGIVCVFVFWQNQINFELFWWTTTILLSSLLSLSICPFIFSEFSSQNINMDCLSPMDQ